MVGWGEHKLGAGVNIASRLRNALYRQLWFIIRNYKMGTKVSLNSTSFHLEFLATSRSQPPGCHWLASSVNLICSCLLGVKKTSSYAKINKRSGDRSRSIWIMREH